MKIEDMMMAGIIMTAEVEVEVEVVNGTQRSGTYKRY